MHFPGPLASLAQPFHPPLSLPSSAVRPCASTVCSPPCPTTFVVPANPLFIYLSLPRFFPPSLSRFNYQLFPAFLEIRAQTNSFFAPTVLSLPPTHISLFLIFFLFLSLSVFFFWLAIDSTDLFVFFCPSLPALAPTIHPTLRFRIHAVSVCEASPWNANIHSRALNGGSGNLVMLRFPSVVSRRSSACLFVSSIPLPPPTDYEMWFANICAIRCIRANTQAMETLDAYSPATSFIVKIEILPVTKFTNVSPVSGEITAWLFEEVTHASSVSSTQVQFCRSLASFRNYLHVNYTKLTNIWTFWRATIFETAKLSIEIRVIILLSLPPKERKRASRTVEPPERTAIVRSTEHKYREKHLTG